MQLKIRMDYLAEIADKGLKEGKEETYHDTRIQMSDVPLFQGDIARWENFWAMFDDAVHSKKRMSPIMKFNYLIKALSGTPLRLAEAYEITNENYELVVKELKTKYGNKEEILDILSTRLQNLPGPTHKASELSQFQATYRSIISQYQRLSPTPVDERQMFNIVIAKLGKHTRREVYLRTEVSKLTLVELDRTLARILQEFEAEEARDKETNKLEGHQRLPARAAVNNISAQSENNQKPLSCNYCQQPHYASQCGSYATVEARCTRRSFSCVLTAWGSSI